MPENIKNYVKKERKKQITKKRYLKNPEEILIRQKAKGFLKAEREYWGIRKSFQNNMKDAAQSLDLKSQEFVPTD